ncbi:MAG: M56 family metallopeptidase [Planctomycetota bacterium]
METLLLELLVNSLIAGAITLCAWLVWRRFAHAPLAHGLLLLALIKLVTPALFRLRLLTPAASVATEAAGVPLDLGTLDVEQLAALSATLTEPAPAVEPASFPMWPLFALWLCGAVVTAWLIRRRAKRCALLLGLAEPAPESVRMIAADLARRAGLRNVPRVHVIDARVSPFAFHAAGHPTIGLPRAVLDALDGRELRAVLAHEVAHLAHRDHLTRWLEVAVAVVHWWNPVARLLRRCVNEVEEVRCDARAVALLESGSRHYGRTILKATSYVEGDLRGLPLGASGLGGSKSMEKRLTMIANDKLSYRAPLAARIVMALGAAALLPLGVTAQDSPKKDVNEEIRALRKEIQELRARLEKLQGNHSAETAPEVRGPVFFTPAPGTAPHAVRAKKAEKGERGESGVWEIRSGDGDEGEGGSMVFHVQGLEEGSHPLVWRMKEGEGQGGGFHFFTKKEKEDGDDDEDDDDDDAPAKKVRGFVLGHPGSMQIEVEGQPMKIDVEKLHGHILESLKNAKIQIPGGVKVLQLDDVTEEHDGEPSKEANGHRIWLRAEGTKDATKEEVKELMKTLHGRIVSPGKNGVIEIVEGEEGGDQPHVIVLRGKDAGVGKEENDDDDDDEPKPAPVQKRLRVRKVEKAEKTEKKDGEAPQTSVGVSIGSAEAPATGALRRA